MYQTVVVLVPFLFSWHHVKNRPSDSRFKKTSKSSFSDICLLAGLPIRYEAQQLGYTERQIYRFETREAEGDTDKNLDWFYGLRPRLSRPSDALLVVPTNVGINFFDKLLEGGVLPITRVQEVCFQPANEALACCVI
ncbi:hypothetical protein ACI2JN_11365 [Ochrobactrum teleogrylli]|uniref:hypothetical protein n=1 Tax=Ochrobactrum teleogrylli TaxID=2479765 RepID=UPI00384CC379